MKRAAAAFMLILRDSVGIEGVLIGVGTSFAAAAAAIAFGPAGACAIVGAVALALGFSVALRGA
jgi:hypothetical protein